MAKVRRDGEEHPGIHWGPFTTRIPFYHTRIEWPELAQGVVVTAATFALAGFSQNEDTTQSEEES